MHDLRRSEDGIRTRDPLLGKELGLSAVRAPRSGVIVIGSVRKQVARKFMSRVVPVVLLLGIEVSVLACSESDEFEFKPRAGGDRYTGW